MSESEFFAARETDFLVHTSIWGDFVGGLVKGVIYAAVGVVACAALAVTFPASLIVGAAVGLAFGFVFGEAVDAIAESIADMVPSSTDAVIITGSPNVHTKSQPAARAAGSISNAVLLGMIEAEQNTTPKGKAEQIADGILQKSITLAKFSVPAVGVAMTMAEVITSGSGQDQSASEANQVQSEAPPPPAASDKKAPQKSFLQSVGDSILSPTVDSANPYATPKDGDKITCQKWHFNDGGLFLAEGSKSVLINSQPACRQGDRSTCEAKIEPEQIGKQKVRIGGKSVVVRDILSGKNPFMAMLGEIVGGAVVGLAQGLIRNGPKALLSCLKEAGCSLMMDAVVTPIVTVISASVGEGLSRAFSSKNPVNYATGGKLLYDNDELDFVLEGQYPLYWQRMYHSLNRDEGLLGMGWTLPFEISLHQASDNQERLIYTDLSGRQLGLDLPQLGCSAFYQDEGFTLYRSLDNVFLLQQEQIFHLFEPNPLKAGYHRLKQQEDRHGNGLYYHYDTSGLLLQIDDSLGGIQVELHYQPLTGRLVSVVEISFDGDTRLARERVRYEYNEASQLIAVRDADNVITRRFDYDKRTGLLCMHQTAAGLKAHYQYQHYAAQGEHAAHYRVVSHQLFADDKQLESMTLEYDLERQCVEVMNAGKGRSFRRWGRHYLITDYVDEQDNVWQFTWDNNDHLTCIKDPNGHDWLFEYDLYGNVESTITPEGQKTHTKWDEDFGLPLAKELANGAKWYYRYNEKGDLVVVTDPDFNETFYGYDGAGNLIYHKDALGNESRYEYNMRG